jgi:hypothetical protein
MEVNIIPEIPWALESVWCSWLTNNKSLEELERWQNKKPHHPNSSSVDF